MTRIFGATSTTRTLCLVLNCTRRVEIQAHLIAGAVCSEEQSHDHDILGIGGAVQFGYFTQLMFKYTKAFTIFHTGFQFIPFVWPYC